MQALSLLLEKDLSFSVGHRDVDAPVQSEVTIAVERAGLCGSDVHVLKTGAWVEYWPATLGHEVCGRVAVSHDTRFPVGTRVVVDSRMPQQTKEGLSSANRLSPSLSWLGEARPGGFSTHFNTSVVTLFTVPESLEPEVAVLAEPLAVVMCAMDSLDQTAVPLRVLILGYGPIGFLAHTEIKRRWNAEVTVIDPIESRLTLASESGAITLTTLPSAEFDLVIDAAGYGKSLPDSMSVVRRGGQILLLALGHKETSLLPSDIVERGIRIVGSIGFENDHLSNSLKVLAMNPSEYRRVVSHVIPLAKFPEFYSSSEASSAHKIIINCEVK